MEHLPGPYVRFRRDYPKLDEAYEKFALACHEAGPLDERSRRLVKLGIAIGASAEGAVKSHARRAMEIGVAREEVHHACLLALTTVGFPAMIAALEWVEEVPEP